MSTKINTYKVTEGMFEGDLKRYYVVRATGARSIESIQYEIVGSFSNKDDAEFFKRALEDHELRHSK